MRPAASKGSSAFTDTGAESTASSGLCQADCRRPGEDSEVEPSSGIDNGTLRALAITRSRTARARHSKSVATRGEAILGHWTDLWRCKWQPCARMNRSTCNAESRRACNTRSAPHRIRFPCSLQLCCPQAMNCPSPRRHHCPHGHRRSNGHRRHRDHRRHQDHHRHHGHRRCPALAPRLSR